MKSGEILHEKVYESPRPIPTSTLKDEPVLFFLQAFGGVLSCFSAVCIFSVFVDPVCVCLLDLVVTLNDYSHDSVDPRLLNLTQFVSCSYSFSSTSRWWSWRASWW